MALFDLKPVSIKIIQCKEYDISYRVYFVIDQDGQWRIYKF